jgi:tetratricopeptide (TPR) repeat protein
MHDTRAVEALIAGLKDRNEPARRNSAWALGKIGDARAVEPLGVALHDESSVVRDFAAKALSEIGGARALELLGWEGAISYRSLSSPVFQWAANDFVGSNHAWVDKVRQENDSAISWFNAQNFAPIPTFAGEKGAADYCFNMASQAQNSGNIQEAWAGYHQALRRFCSLMDEKMIGLTCFNLGKAYGNRGNWEMAQLMFLHSACLAGQSGEKKGYAWALAYLGDTCERLGNKTLAKQFLSTALLIFKDVSPEDAEGVENNLRRLTES